MVSLRRASERFRDPEPTGADTMRFVLDSRLLSYVGCCELLLTNPFFFFLLLPLVAGWLAAQMDHGDW